MDEPKRIIVEVISHADVARLEARNEDLRKEIAECNRKIEGLHRTIYELLESFSGKKGRS